MRTPTLLVILAMTSNTLWAQITPISFLSRPKVRGFDVDIQVQQSFMVDLYQIQTLANTYHRNWTGFLFHSVDFNSEAGIHSFVGAISRKLDPHISLLGGYGLKRVNSLESGSTTHSISIGVDMAFSKVWWQTRLDQLTVMRNSDLASPMLRSELTLYPKSSYRTYLVVQWPLMQEPQWQMIGAWDLDDKWTLAIMGSGMTFQLGLCIQYHISKSNSVRLSNLYNLVLGSSPAFGLHYGRESSKYSE